MWIEQLESRVLLSLAPSPATATVSGRVFQDINSDGMFTVNSDTGFAFVTVYLDINNAGSFVAGDPSMMTDVLGNYSFSAVTPGSTGTVRLNPQPTALYVETDTAATGFTADAGSDSTVNLAFFPIVFNGNSAADAYTVSVSATNTLITGGGFSYSASSSDLPSLTFNLGDGDDSMSIDLSGGNPVPPGGINVDGGMGTDSLTISSFTGNNSISIDATKVIANGSTINYSNIESIAVNTGSGNDSLTQNAQPGNGASLTFSGGTGNDSLVIIGGSFTIPADPVTTGTSQLSIIVAPAGSLTFAGNDAATHGIRPYHLNALTVDGPVTLAPAASGLTADRTVLTTNVLSATGTHDLDLTSNSIAIDYSSLGSPISSIQSAIQNGAIYSSLADDGIHALGYVDQPNAETITIRYTIIGDLNLDGTVNFPDLLQLSQSYGMVNASWSTGDLNGDGSTGFSDLLALAQHYNQSLT